MAFVGLPCVQNVHCRSCMHGKMQWVFIQGIDTLSVSQEKGVYYYLFSLVFNVLCRSCMHGNMQ